VWGQFGTRLELGQRLEPEPVEHRLEPAALQEGLVRVEFARSHIEPRNRRKYPTRLTNTTDEPLRVLRFGGYRRLDDGGFELSTVSGRLFSAAEFREWYAVADADGWLPPGTTVVDPDNHGGPRLLWAYEIEWESGGRAWVGGVGP
jgi:hypothetical protein